MLRSVNFCNKKYEFRNTKPCRTAEICILLSLLADVGSESRIRKWKQVLTCHKIPGEMRRNVENYQRLVANFTAKLI